MSPKTELDRLAVLLMIVLCVVWGVQQVTIKLAAVGITPIWQAGLRSLGASVLVFAWSRWRGVRLFDADRTLWPGLLCGALFSIEFAFIFMGLEYTTASRGVIFLYTAPFFVALGAKWLLPHEPMRRAQWLGMALAFAGVVILFGENLLHGSGRAWLGDLLMLIGAMFWAATTLTVKASALARASAEKMLLYQLGVSALALPLLALVVGEAGLFAPTLSVFASLAFQIVLVASASYLTWFWLIRNYPATRLSSFSFLTPVLGVLAGGLVLGEALTPMVFIALGLVGAGIWVANRG